MRLEVIYKELIKAGELWRDDKGYHFVYDDEFIENPTTGPISVNMPKEQKEYHSDDLFHYFKSILSEGWLREKQSKALGIDPTDDFALLAYTCTDDVIGAITVKIIEE